MITLRRTKIVATLGPAVTSSDTMLEKLIEHGINVARFNMSHGTQADHADTFNRVKKASEKTGKLVAMMADIRGPKIRTGMLKDGKVTLVANDKITLTTRNIVGEGKLIPVDYPKFTSMVHVKSKVFLADGAYELEVLSIDGTEIECLVIIGGDLGNRKGVNVPHVALDLPSLSEKDISDVEFAVKMGFDFIAQSYVRDAKDVMELRAMLERLGSDAQIIAKIEDAAGFHNLNEIVHVADGLMVARGDLGVQLPIEDIPTIQKHMVMLAKKAGKPIIIATQMLESMIKNPVPTRAEASDVANGVIDGADALMLSGESASGAYPLKAVEMMDRVIRKAEGTLASYNLMKEFDGSFQLTVPQAIAKSVCFTAKDLKANAIVTYTSAGHTPRFISKYRPFTPILAITPNKRELGKLQLIWGVNPILVEQPKDTDDLVSKCVEQAIKKDLVAQGDLLVITGGIPLDIAGNTNFMKVHVV